MQAETEWSGLCGDEASQGLLALRPGDDDRERNFLKDAGFQDFALQIGGRSYTLSWLSPFSMPLFAGAALMEAGGWASVSAFLEGMKSATDSVLETSMLSSLEQLLEGVGYAESKPWYILSSLLLDYASQGVPTVLGKLASAADGTVRSAYVPAGKGEMEKDLSFFLQGLQRKVPIARNTMQPKIDLWGREVSNGGALERGLESFLSPGYYSQVRDDALTQELQRLSEAVGSSAVLPAKVGKSFKVGEETKYLTAEEYTRYARIVGQTRREVLEQMVGQTGYQRLSDEEKAAAVADVYAYANAVGKMEVSDYTPADRSVAKGALKSALPPASYFLYLRHRDRNGDGHITGTESALALLELAGLSNDQRGAAWGAANSSTKPEKNPFTGALAEADIPAEDAIEIYEQYRTLSNDDGKKPEEKAAAFARYVRGLGLTAAQIQAVRETYAFFGSYPVEW